MARGKAISVKIATVKVIKALESALTKLEIDYKEQEHNEAKFSKAVEKWQKEVGKLAISAMNKATDLSANTRYNGEINVSFSLPKGSLDLPAQPERDFVTMHQWQYTEKHNELSNAIRILKMTDEEVVSTSTYNAVAQYL
jgi:hypothetical protein